MMREIILESLDSKNLMNYIQENYYSAKIVNLEKINDWIKEEIVGRVVEWKFCYWFEREDDRALYLLTWVDK